jgi:hypothetical protein
MAGKSYLKSDSGAWTRIKKMYVKTGGTTWTAIRKAYVKADNGFWKKVFDTGSNRPFIRGNDYPKIRLNTYRTNSGSAGTINPVIEAPPVQFAGPRSNNVQGVTEAQPVEGYPDDNMGTMLFGYDGDWVSGNGTSMTPSYAWFYNNDGNPNVVEPFTNTNPTYDDRVTNDSTRFKDKLTGFLYGCSVYFRVTQTNSAGPASEVSVPVRIIKQPPNDFTFVMTAPGFGAIGAPKVVTVAGENLWYNGPDQYESKIEWFSEDSLTSPLLNSTTLVQTETLSSITPTTEGDGTAINDTSSYTPSQSNATGYSDSNKYLFARLTLKNSGSEYTGNQRVFTVNMTSPVGVVNEKTPQWGEEIYVSTNGYIGLAGSTSNSSISDTSTNGHVLSFLNRDLKQNNLRYWADTTKYIVDWSGRLYDATSTSVTYRYQAHFYPGQNYVDFYVISNAGGTSANAYLYNGQQQVPWGASKPTNTAYRITIKSGVAFEAITYNPTPTTDFIAVPTMNEADDAVTTLTLTKGVAKPVNQVNPEFQLVSGNANKVGATYRLTSGTWSESPTEYNYYIIKNDINGTTLANSGWTTNTSYNYTFTATSAQTVSGYVLARNAGGEGIGAYSISIGPITVDFTAPTPTGVTWNGTSFVVTFAGGSGPYYQLWYEKGSSPTPPTSTTGYDSSGLLPTSSPFSVTYTPGGVSTGEVWNFWLRSASSATSSSTGVDRGDYSSNYVSVTIPGPSAFSISIYDSTTIPNQPSLTVTYTSPNVNIDWADDTNATGGYYSTITEVGGSTRQNARSVSNDFWSVTEGKSYNGTVYAINSTKSVTMYWGNVPGAQSYRVAYDIDGGTTQVIDKGSAISHTVFTSGAVRVLGIAAYETSNYGGASTTGSYDPLFFVTPTNKNSATSNWSRDIPVTPIIPTVTIAANSGVGQNGGTINWTSTNQARYSVDGTFAASGNPDTTTRSVSKTGLTASTTYTGTITVTSSTGNTATASYSLRTADPAANYNLQYNSNGGSGTMTDTVGNGSVVLKANGFTRTNCSFAGWNTNSAGTGTNYGAGASYTLSSNGTLYAKWTANANSATAPTVSFTGTSGSGSSTTRSWSWTTGTVTGGTATGYEWQISSTGSTSGYGAWTFTTARTLTVTANSPRWVRVRKIYTDGLGVRKEGPFNNTGV